MDLTTIAPFPAAKTLVEILNKLSNKKLSNKVCSTLSDFRSTLICITYIENIGIRKKLALLWKKESERIIKALKLPDEVERFTLNVESTLFKIYTKNYF